MERRVGEGVFFPPAAKQHLKANRRFPFLNLEELQRGHVTGDGGGEGYAIISDIKDIHGVIGSHLKALQITEERKTRATCADTRVFGLKRSRLCPIPDCFPTLSQTGSLNPVNDYSRYLRYHLRDLPRTSAEKLSF